MSTPAPAQTDVPDLRAPDRTHRLPTSDGLTLSVYEWDGGASAHPVLLHHGFSSSASLEWPHSGLPQALLARGRRVLAVDARGHGASDAPHDSASYGEARMAQDVLEVLDALGLDRVDLAGYSMGAVVSLVFASRHGDRLHRLVVGGVGAGVVELGGVDTRALPASELARALRAPDPGDLGEGLLRSFRESAAATGNDLLALAAQADAVHASPLDLASIPVPTLVVAGREDPLAVRPQVLVDAVPGAHLLLVAGEHTTAFEDPRFVPGITAFLQP
ncbi:alpha/beta fold hydrolase [Kineococcus sp. LSe6-4]|uniref:Alpha/beta fold hydrolase n=1 Tax=Kineococcus halophytocola TaxID=3234027 RepID=A0ABV4GZW8_9ACTN